MGGKKEVIYSSLLSPGAFCCRFPFANSSFRLRRALRQPKNSSAGFCPAGSPPPSCLCPDTEWFLLPCPRIYPRSRRISPAPDPASFIDPGECSSLAMPVGLVGDNLLFVAFLEVARKRRCEVCGAFLAFPVAGIL